MSCSWRILQYLFYFQVLWRKSWSGFSKWSFYGDSIFFHGFSCEVWSDFSFYLQPRRVLSVGHFGLHLPVDEEGPAILLYAQAGLQVRYFIMSRYHVKIPSFLVSVALEGPVVPLSHFPTFLPFPPPPPPPSPFLLPLSLPTSPLHPSVPPPLPHSLKPNLSDSRVDFLKVPRNFSHSATFNSPGAVYSSSSSFVLGFWTSRTFFSYCTQL